MAVGDCWTIAETGAVLIESTSVVLLLLLLLLSSPFILALSTGSVLLGLGLLNIKEINKFRMKKVGQPRIVAGSLLLENTEQVSAPAGTATSTRPPPKGQDGGAFCKESVSSPQHITGRFTSC